MIKSKIDIIYDMVNLAYDVKRQCGRDKDLNYFIGNYAQKVINAKDNKVYDNFVILAERLEEEGWEQFIDWSKNLINEYNQIIEESKKSTRKSLKESKKFFYYPCYVSDDRDEEGYIDYHGHLTSDISKAPLFETEQELGKWFNKLNWYKWYSDYEMRTEGMYVDEKDYEDYNIIKESLKFAKKSLKESKIMSYKDFQDVCMEESENDIINFHEYKGAYFVILRTEEECERLLRVLRDKYRFEGTCYKIIDPYNPNYKCYEIMCV